MRILIAADIFPPVSGGPATYSVGLANEFTKSGTEVTIVSLTPGSDASKVTCPVFAVRKDTNKIFRYFEYAWLLFREARKVDLIYAMGPVNAGLPALLAAKILRKKVVVKVVGDYAWEQGSQRFGVTDLMDDFQVKKYGGAVGLLRKIESFVTTRVNRVIVPSEYLKKIVTGWGVKSDRVSVIFNAIPLPEIAAVQTVQTKNQAEQWIVYIGRLVPWKGAKEVIEIMPELTKEFPNARFKIVGDGPDRSNVEKTISTQGMERYVELVGNVPHAQALSYLKSADVFVLNSGYEGLSHVLVEALNFNCKVLASNICGNPEVIIPAETGELFTYNNKAEIKEKLRAALSGAMRPPFSNTIDRETFFKKFEFNRMVAETKKLLETI